MWMLLDTTGRTLFYILDSLVFIVAVAYLVWDARRDDEVEKGRRSGYTGSQRKGTKGKDQSTS